MKNRRCSRGFSLIELLMASVVVAAAGALLVGGLIGANRSTALRVERILSTQLLASELALLDRQLGPDTPTSGHFSPPFEDVQWTLAWTPTPRAPLVEATLTVSRGDHHVDAVTYRQLATEP